MRNCKNKKNWGRVASNCTEIENYKRIIRKSNRRDIRSTRALVRSSLNKWIYLDIPTFIYKKIRRR